MTPTTRHGPAMLLTAALVALIATSPVSGQAQQQHASQSNATTAADPLLVRLDSTVPALMRAGDIPGLSAAVVRDGALYWIAAFGVRNAETRAPVDRNTVFDAASLTKPVVAYAVLRLADRGEIDLDTPIARILPNDRMRHDPRYERITPRMVLSHATGLPNWGGDRLDLAFDPGTGWGYSGEGFVWLANAVEKRTGLAIDDVVRREVFQPLGMGRSSLVWNDSLEANGAVPHSEWGRPRPRQRPAPEALGRANAAASLRTTAHDYARFLIAVMNGAGLQPATARQMLAVQNEAKDAASYRSRPADLRARIAWGLGWGLERRDSGLTVWHWGDNGDMKAYVVGDPQRRTAIVYFANATTGLSIAAPMASLVIPGEQYAAAWLEYERHDSPARVVRRAIVRAALDSGAAAGVRRYRDERTRRPDAATLAVARAAGEALGAERATAAADSLYAALERDFPDSASVSVARGDLHLFASDDARALAHYERALSVTPADSVARGRAEWARAGLRAREHRVTLTAEALQRFAGDFGPRRVTFEGGTLHYQRGSGRKYALVPMTGDTFALDGNPTFRLRFVAAGPGPATKVVGLYHDGRRDENERTA